MKIHYSNQGQYKGKLKSVFLAGPTTRNNPEPLTWWRQELLDMWTDLWPAGTAENADEVVFFVPEPSDQKWPDFKTQVDWEINHLWAADCIAFWVPRYFENHAEHPNHPALTTNVEFGIWYNDEKTVYGRPNDSEKNRYLDYLWETVDNGINDRPPETLKELSNAIAWKIELDSNYKF